jgi:hypothetical protein
MKKENKTRKEGREKRVVRVTLSTMQYHGGKT